MITLICANLLLALFVATKLLGGKSLNRIKARTVGHGQHGSARWATRREIKSYYTMVLYEPQKWRTQPEIRPTQPGFVLGSFQHGRHGKKITAWVDAGDSHAMMIASPGGGKTAYGRTLFQMLERIRRYKYDPHFHENAEVKAEAQQAANEQTTTEAKEKKGLFKRIAGFFGRLFRKDKSK